MTTLRPLAVAVAVALLAVWASAWAQGHGPLEAQGLGQSCHEVIDCHDPLDVLSSDKRELSAATSKEDMDRLCPSIQQHLECIERHTRRCMALDMRMTFNVLYNGTIVVMNELCHNDTYQQEYLKYARCFKEMKNEEDCEAKYSETLAEIQKGPESHDAVFRICCAFQTYLQCSKRTVGAVCGDAAADFNAQMLDTMSSSLKAQCAQVAAAEADACKALSLASRTAAGGGAGSPPRLLLASAPALLLLMGRLPLLQRG